MKILVDMNLSPVWIRFFGHHGHEAVHWSSVGDPKAPDVAVMEWARQHGCVLFTHDLDFAVLLAHTRAGGPSVVQVRTHDVLPGALGDDVVWVLREHREALERGAIVSVDAVASRVRILPIVKGVK